MRECGRCLIEALELGKMVRHRGGDEGIDELWGEPFKAFSMPIDAFYSSRYLKIAMTMHDVDRITGAMKATFVGSRQIVGLDARLDELNVTAKRKCEILRTDPAVFDIWPSYVVASDRVRNLEPIMPAQHDAVDVREAVEGSRLLHDGTDLIGFIVRARVPMPKSTREYIDRCQQFRRAYIESYLSVPAHPIKRT